MAFSHFTLSMQLLATLPTTMMTMTTMTTMLTMAAAVMLMAAAESARVTAAAVVSAGAAPAVHLQLTLLQLSVSVARRTCGFCGTQRSMRRGQRRSQRHRCRHNMWPCQRGLRKHRLGQGKGISWHLLLPLLLLPGMSMAQALHRILLLPFLILFRTRLLLLLLVPLLHMPLAPQRLELPPDRRSYMR